MKGNKFEKQERKLIAGFLTQKNTAYNIGISDGKDWHEETQINYHDNVDDFIDALEHDIAEMDFPQTPGMLTLMRTVVIEYIEPDHYLAEEGIEDKKFASPNWKELDPVVILVPSQNQIIRIQEGSGDNLSAEDMEAGLVDYIYYAQFNADDVREQFDLDNSKEECELDEIAEEIDGGQIDQTEMLRDKYSSLEQAIPEVLDFVYGDAKLEYKKLQNVM